MGFVLKTNCKKKPFIVFHFWEFQKQQQEDIAVSPQYWARAAASKVVEQQASPKISVKHKVLSYWCSPQASYQCSPQRY